MYAVLYDMCARFQSVYHHGNRNYAEPLMNRTDFKNYAPVTVIDCTGLQKKMTKMLAI